MAAQPPSPALADDVEALTGPSAVDLPAARELVRIFAKTARATRLYARNNEVYQRFWSELCTRMMAYLDANQVLSLQIGTHEVRVSDEVVFQPQQQDDNFAYRLYKDGLRQMDFVRGLTVEELQRLLEVITADFERGDFQDKDVISLLWECEFRHIFTLSVDSFVQEAQVEGQEEEDEPAEQPASMVSDAEAESLFELLQQSSEINLLKLDKEEKRQYRMVSQSSSSFVERGTENVTGTIFTLDPGLEQRLKAEVEALAEEETPLDPVAEVLFELYRQELPEEFPQLIQVTLGVMETLLADGDLESLNHLLFPLRLLSMPDYARAFLHHGLVLELFSHLGQPARLDPLLPVLQDRRLRGGENALFGFMSLMVPDRVAGLMSWLERIQDEAYRQAALEGLIVAAGEELQPFLQAARSPNPMLVADVIKSMGRLASMSSLEVVLSAFSHAEPRVREEAVIALRSFESPRARETIFLALSDGAESVRLAALRTLTVAHDRATARYITELLQSKQLKGRSFTELRALCMALAHIQGNDAVLLLSGLLKHRKTPELQRAAAHGLAVVGGADVRRHLEQVIRESSPPLSDECRTLLSQLKQ